MRLGVRLTHVLNVRRSGLHSELQNSIYYRLMQYFTKLLIVLCEAYRKRQTILEFQLESVDIRCRLR